MTPGSSLPPTPPSPGDGAPLSPAGDETTLSAADRRTAVLAVVVVLLALTGLAGWVVAGDPSTPPPVAAPASAPLTPDAGVTPTATPGRTVPSPGTSAVPPPGPPTARSTPGRGEPSAGSTQAAGSVAAIDWTAVPFPLDCQGLGVDVQDVVRGSLIDPGPAGHGGTGTQAGAGGSTDDGSEAVVRVRCAAGAGSPASALFVFSAPAGATTPVLRAELLGPADGLLITQVSVQDRQVVATGTGYSTDDVPRCCPDRTVRLTWRWDGASFARAG